MLRTILRVDSSQRLQRIEEVFRSAREREPGERETFLADACRGDQELRREVESMLIQDEREGILERSAMEVAGDLLADPAAEHPATGAQLGPYQIESSLGAGGMGEVYRARDTRLNRTVAIKILKEQFSDRFEREARAIAALNHPNICTLHDVGPNYLVMELVEGRTLAERIGEGAIPLQESLGIAGQIADALAAAHEKGIVHRDLKPANSKITAADTVKVLDFGLAKVDAPPASESSPENSRLTKEPLTQSGVVLGTAGYMAPEQLRGDAIDKRVDIWAFGVVLYEMLTGQRLFQGETPSDALVAVLTKEPDWERVPPRYTKAAPPLSGKRSSSAPARHRRRYAVARWRAQRPPPQGAPGWPGAWPLSPLSLPHSSLCRIFARPFRRRGASVSRSHSLRIRRSSTFRRTGAISHSLPWATAAGFRSDGSTRFKLNSCGGPKRRMNRFGLPTALHWLSSWKS